MAVATSPSSEVAPVLPRECEQLHGVEYARERYDDSQRGERPGLKIDPVFCPDNDQSPFDTVAWELRSAAIKDESGKVLFEQTDCEVPATWTQLAANVVVSKYFYGDPRNPGEPYTTTWFDMFRIEDGMIAEHWDYGRRQ
jgi:hypothetical protein